MKEFAIDGEYVVLNTPYAEAYIPMELVDLTNKSESAVTSKYGEGIKTLGLFNMRFYQSENDSRYSSPLKTFNFPNTIITYPTSYKSQKLSIDNYEDEEKYLVMEYHRGDIIMSTVAKEDSENCEKFLHVLTSGKIPKTLKYEDVLKAWEKNFAINSVSPGAPSLSLQIIISELYRDKKDYSKQFRKTIGQGKAGPTDYYPANMRQVTAMNNVFSALTFESMGDMLTTSLNMSIENVPQVKSPIEDILTM